LFFEQVGAIERLVGALDAGEGCALAAGEVFGVLPQRKACAFEFAGGGGDCPSFCV
jgi:hypothetical protein